MSRRFNENAYAFDGTCVSFTMNDESLFFEEEDSSRLEQIYGKAINSGFRRDLPPRQQKTKNARKL